MLLLNLIYKTNKKAINLLDIKRQDLLEKINLCKESIEREKLRIISLDKKNSRYALLKQALDKFNQSLILGEVGKVVADETFELFAGSGNIFVYLINRENSKLEMLFSRKIDPELIIKEKHGDLFDGWVLRHNQALLVEDANKDFRFDPEQINNEISRHIGSVIIAPLITPNSFMGILRVESSQPAKFSSDDLRFLSTVANLASISIENSLLYEHTEELAIKDGLTGLYLRRFLNGRGKEEVQYAFKQNCELSVLMIDIDYFKKYNDKFGHRAGDIVLVHIADLLKGVFSSPKYVVSRFGGEEFAVLLPDTNKSEALKLAEELRKGIEGGIILLRRSPVRITVSIGVATYPMHADSWMDLVRQSDAAMYKAKQAGRNKVCSV
ncbi:MAG: sensor domain-containing diguanylate cyclase [Candidatus Omnitrophica bacterium]|nr:sensor domain-containing diguanylate cyclase [Candidatus Omnitrophota bacterium]MDD5352180.1 sensor domain-containing diguanylate cyclase [Candidatus Omnitrophota bacterium]MDD5549778.1 sensor domain-containing diguanylate cyclase [Candidatus Omnitrophota bacterium]